MRRLIPTIREIFTNAPFKIFVSESLLVLDSNRVAQTSRVFKISIERELVISVEVCDFIKSKYRTFKNYLTKNSPIVLVSNEINYLIRETNNNALFCYPCMGQRLPRKFKLSKLP